MTQSRAQEPDRVLAALRADPAVRAVEQRIRAEDARTIETQVELSEIAAPPFGEEARGRRVAEMMGEAGLTGVCIDEVGNVLGWSAADSWDGRDREVRDAARPGPVVVSAHLDTVFPAGTEVLVRRRGDVLRGPGISDDARGLATLVALARTMPDVPASSTDRAVLFVATVGEEGPGDLRGVKHLFGLGGAARGAAAFLSLDGAGLDRIVARGLGSRRYRAVAIGPGGHSWVDWGAPNPIHALGIVVARLAALPLPDDPISTLTVARWGGGKSINAIPQTAWIEIDTRSESERCLADLETRIRDVIADVTGDASGPPGADAATAGVRFELRTIGVRPGGGTSPRSPLVQAALAATRAAGREPEITLSSTDANIPMSLGIPAITLGCGGEAGKAHTTDEWYRNVLGPEGVIRALHTVLLARSLVATRA